MEHAAVKRRLISPSTDEVISDERKRPTYNLSKHNCRLGYSEVKHQKTKKLVQTCGTEV